MKEKFINFKNKDKIKINEENQNQRIIKFSYEIMKQGYTPIFEFISPKNRIVIEYKEKELCLLAIRNTITGLNLLLF
jgi:hypothetical protein